MKKHLALLGAVLATGVLNVPAHAADPFYVSGNVGTSAFNDIDVIVHTTRLPHGTITTGSGINLMGAIGAQFDSFRLEAELGYQRNNAQKIKSSHGTFNLSGNFSITSYMANAYHDFNAGAIKPYITAGIGLADVAVHNVPDPPVVLSETHSVLGYQFGAGAAVPLAKNVLLDLRYRYFGTDTVSLSNNGDIKVPGNSLLAGLRINL
ncbi:MAG: porin family protein [Chlorobiaceae bacterium]|nr:porin family protein [Chlorobiaceae bacterium]